MCGVDVADQLRSYYNTQRIHRKTWKPLFHFLLDTIIGNCYQLSSYKPVGHYHEREKSHKQFRKDLRNTLFKNSIRIRRHPKHKVAKRKGTDDIIWEPVVQHKLIKLQAKKPQNCSACIDAGRKSTTHHLGSRKALADLSTNTTRQSRDSKDWKRPQRCGRTLFGCSVCRIPFCRKDECWGSHITRLSTKN